MQQAITIRPSRPADSAAMWRLAGLDDRPAPSGHVLLAFVGDELRAAKSLDRGAVVADPFHSTDDVVGLLELRASQEVSR